MSGDLRTSLANALGMEVKPLGKIQGLYNQHKRFLSGKVIKTPLPEEIHLLDDNFPYWIKMETPNPSIAGESAGVTAKVIIPMLDKGDLDDAGFTFDEKRANALLNLPTLLRNPNCIHVNLRHADRGQGGIQGRYVYVEYFKGNTRKVAFTTYNELRKLNVLVTSFWTYKGWVVDCAENPAIYVRPGSKCTCCK
jgi:hypothetical protein